MGLHTERGRAMSKDLPDRLRATAEGFEPDTERMWTRVASAMDQPDAVGAEPMRRRSRLPHLALATGAVVMLIGAIVFGGYGLRPTVEQPPAEPSETSSIEPTETTPEGTPSEKPSEEPSDDASNDPEEGRTPEAGRSSEPAERPESVDEADYLTAEAKINGNYNDYWSQSEVTFQNEEPITEMTVELHVVTREDIEVTGSWTTAAHYFGEAEIFERDGYLIFRWTLLDDQTVPPGEQTLAGQYNHGDGARQTDRDYFMIEAVSASGKGTVVGDVAPPA